MALKPPTVEDPDETLRIVALEKFELVEYCNVYPEAFETEPTVTAIELEPDLLTLNVGADKGMELLKAIVCVPAELTA